MVVRGDRGRRIEDNSPHREELLDTHPPKDRELMTHISKVTSVNHDGWPLTWMGMTWPWSSGEGKVRDKV